MPSSSLLTLLCSYCEQQKAPSDMQAPIFHDDPACCIQCDSFFSEMIEPYRPVSTLEEMKAQYGQLMAIKVAGEIKCRIGNFYNKTEKILMLPCSLVKDECCVFGVTIHIPFPVNEDVIDLSNSCNFVELADSYPYHVSFHSN